MVEAKFLGGPLDSLVAAAAAALRAAKNQAKEASEMKLYMWIRMLGNECALKNRMNGKTLPYMGCASQSS